MIKKIKTYKYQKVEISSTDLEIPETTLYCFQTGIRRAIRIIPEYTTWNKEENNKDEEIYSLNVTCVYNSFEAKVEIYNLAISSMEDMINTNKDSYNIGDMLLNKDYNTRTKEQFEEDLKAVLDKL